jgi:hypothetical protein
MTDADERYRAGVAAAEQRAAETMEWPSYAEYGEMIEAAGMTHVVENDEESAEQSMAFMTGFAVKWCELGGTAPEGVAFDPRMN